MWPISKSDTFHFFPCSLFLQIFEGRGNAYSILIIVSWALIIYSLSSHHFYIIGLTFQKKNYNFHEVLKFVSPISSLFFILSLLKRVSDLFSILCDYCCIITFWMLSLSTTVCFDSLSQLSYSLHRDLCILFCCSAPLMKIVLFMLITFSVYLAI